MNILRMYSFGSTITTNTSLRPNMNSIRAVLRSSFVKSASRLLPDGWVGLKSSGYRCHFRAFQLKLFILDTRNFGNGSVVQKLQLFEVARISDFFGRPEKKSTTRQRSSSHMT